MIKKFLSCDLHVIIICLAQYQVVASPYKLNLIVKNKSGNLLKIWNGPSLEHVSIIISINIS